jgi:selenide,water dikinase
LQQVSKAVTDVSGFGLIGHTSELAEASQVGAVINAHAVPVLPGAIEYADRGILTGGGARNAKHFEPMLTVANGIEQALVTVLHDPQTAGGLLFSVQPARESDLAQRFLAAGIQIWQVGTLTKDRGIVVRA